tara:strand:- start:144 stop:275 length:132 start_codon:yes stop_codon:yes gene_type:complete
MEISFIVEESTMAVYFGFWFFIIFGCLFMACRQVVVEKSKEEE